MNLQVRQRFRQHCGFRGMRCTAEQHEPGQTQGSGQRQDYAELFHRRFSTFWSAASPQGTNWLMLFVFSRLDGGILAATPRNQQVEFIECDTKPFQGMHGLSTDRPAEVARPIEKQRTGNMTALRTNPKPAILNSPLFCNICYMELVNRVWCVPS
jgi:hypothetical protein